MGKGQNAGYQNFLLFLQCLKKKPSLLCFLKIWVVCLSKKIPITSYILKYVHTKISTDVPEREENQHLICMDTHNKQCAYASKNRNLLHGLLQQNIIQRNIIQSIQFETNL